MAIPKIRFPQFKSEWKEVSLNEVFQERNDKSVITEKYPLLSFTIEEGIIKPENKKTNKRDFLIKDKDNKKFLITKFNDIIYNPANIKYGAIHRNKLGNGCVSPIYAIFSTTENPQFMEYVVRNPKFIKKSLRYLEGTVIKLMTLKPNDFLKMNVYIPEKEEQEKIADFLISVDEIIKITENEIKSLEQQKREITKKIFTHEIRFKKADGTEYEAWERTSLNDIVSFDRGSGLSKDVVNNIEGKNKCILYGHLYTEYGAIISNIKYYTNNIENKKLSKKGDILMPGSDVTPRGLATASCINEENVILGGDINILRPKIDISSEFLSYCINYNKDMIYKIIVGTSIRHLHNKDLSKLIYSIPKNLEEQEKIADFLYSIDKYIDLASKELNIYKEMKKGLIQQMII